MRISNFLLWQIAYAELYVTETLWPDFTRTDLLQAVLEYQKRDRRYGGLSGGAVANGAAEAARRDPDRSPALLMKRILTAAALIPVAVYAVFWADPWVFLAVLATVACLCYREYDGIAAGYGFGAPGPLGYAFGVWLLLWPGDVGLPLAVAAIFALAWGLRGRPERHAAARSPADPRGDLHFRLLALRHLSARARAALADVRPALNWVGDIGAYYVGRRFGRHKMAPHVSPNKSWEGAAASVVTSVVLAGGYLLRVGAGRAGVAGRAADRRGQCRRTVGRPGRIGHEARRGGEGQRRRCCPGTAASSTAWTARCSRCR